MKVLIWSQYFWPETFLINSLVEKLAGNGVQVTVITGKPNYPEGKIFPGYVASGIQLDEFSGVEIIRIPLAPRGKSGSLGLTLNYLSFIASGYLFAPYALRGRKFDAVFVYAPSPLLQALPAIFVAWLKRASLVVWVQDIWPEALAATGFVRNRGILRAVELLVRYIYRYTDSILIQSEAFRDPIRRLVSDHRKIRFYPNSAPDVSHVHRSDLKPAPLLAEIAARFSVVFAGNIGKAQSCETIVEAAELLRHHDSIHFYLIGAGSQLPEVSEAIGRRGLTNITAPGAFPFDQMAAIFAAASVLLVSLRRDPALAATIPSKLQSYMSAGRPIIASMDGEGARIVRLAQAGIATPAEDAAQLAGAVLDLFRASEPMRQKMGESARRYYDAYFHSRERVDELVDHLRELTEAGGSVAVPAWQLPADGVALKISIITVSFNSAETIERTLRSVAEQSYPHIEHIVVDGSSTDSTCTVIRENIGRVSQFVSEPDQGIYDAMNKGLRLATGDVVAFLNSDDFYSSEHVISNIARMLAEDAELDAVFGDVAYFAAGRPTRQIRRYRSAKFRPDLLAWGWMPAHPAIFVRREIFSTVGGFKPSYRIAGDYEWIARAFRTRGLKYRHVSKILVRMQSGGASSAGWRNTLRLNREVIAACRENGIETNWLKILSKYPVKLLGFFDT